MADDGEHGGDSSSPGPMWRSAKRSSSGRGGALGHRGSSGSGARSSRLSPGTTRGWRLAPACASPVRSGAPESFREWLPLRRPDLPVGSSPARGRRRPEASGRPRIAREPAGEGYVGPRRAHGGRRKGCGDGPATDRGGGAGRDAGHQPGGVRRRRRRRRRAAISLEDADGEGSDDSSDDELRRQQRRQQRRRRATSRRHRPGPSARDAASSPRSSARSARHRPAALRRRGRRRGVRGRPRRRPRRDPRRPRDARATPTPSTPRPSRTPASTSTTRPASTRRPRRRSRPSPRRTRRSTTTEFQEASDEHQRRSSPAAARPDRPPSGRRGQAPVDLAAFSAS